MKYISDSTEKTEAIAAEFAKKLKGGEIITLDGDLGAGKTAFVRGLAKGLGITDRVVSPTFTIVNEYRHGKIPLFHFDVYRIGSSDEMYDVGWEEYINSGGIAVVEWAVNIEDILDENCIKINIAKNLDISDDYREITLRGVQNV